MATKDGNWDLVPHSEKSWSNATMDNGAGRRDARKVGLFSSSTSSSSVDELKRLIKPTDSFKASAAAADLFTNRLDYVEDAIEEFRRNGVDSELNNVDNNVSLTLRADHDRIAAAAACSYRRDVSQPQFFEQLPVVVDRGRLRAAIMPIGSSMNAANYATDDGRVQQLDAVVATLEDDHRHGQAAGVNPRKSSRPAASVQMTGDEDQDQLWSSTRIRRRAGQCVFCRNNGESRVDYESHVVKDRHGRVTCPVLRHYTCPICSATGDEAHTIRYCPLNKHRDRTAVATLIRSLNDKFTSTMSVVSSTADVTAAVHLSSASETGSSCVKLHKKRDSNRWLLR